MLDHLFLHRSLVLMLWASTLIYFWAWTQQEGKSWCYCVLGSNFFGLFGWTVMLEYLRINLRMLIHYGRESGIFYLFGLQNLYLLGECLFSPDL